jgi:hypothetical protein
VDEDGGAQTTLAGRTVACGALEPGWRLHLDCRARTWLAPCALKHLAATDGGLAAFQTRTSRDLWLTSVEPDINGKTTKLLPQFHNPSSLANCRCVVWVQSRDESRNSMIFGKAPAALRASTLSHVRFLPDTE